MPVEETENEIRIRVKDPSSFDQDSFRRVTLDESQGIYAIVGCPSGHFKSGKCDTGTEVQSLRFDGDKWTKSEAEAWARKHDYTPKCFQVFDISKNFDFSFNIVKIQREHRIIEGYASVEIVDREDELITRQALQEAIDGFKKNPILRWMHKYPIGNVIDMMVDNVGLYVKAYITDKTEKAREVWGLIEDGIVKTFSIMGKILEVVRKYNEKVKRKIREITKIELYEISVVDIPANPETFFQVVKKSLGEMKMSEEAASSLEERLTVLEQRVSALENKEEELEEEVEEVKEEVEEEVAAAAKPKLVKVEYKEEPRIDIEKLAEQVVEAAKKKLPIRKGIVEAEKPKDEPMEKDFTIREALKIKYGGRRG